MAKFNGSLEALKNIVERTSFDGKWRELPNSQHQFKANNGAIINWWPSKGTLNFQGPTAEKEALEKAFLANSEDSDAVAVPAPKKPNPKQTIFIVHGHDKSARDELELILRRLGLDPYILQNEPGAGLTLIEALEGQIGKEAKAVYGIVLMTPDDLGYAEADGEESKRPRARQNVVLEMGMLLSSLTRSKVAIIKHVSVEEPSDAQGIIYLAYDKRVEEIRTKLVQNLQKAGIEIDPAKIASA